MRTRFDHLAKQIGEEALCPSGLTVTEDEILPNAQRADLRHEPDPMRGAERARLGLLGRLASVLCLMEFYGHAPNGEALDIWGSGSPDGALRPKPLRACLSKHLAFWQQRTCKARATKNKQKAKRPLPPFVEPHLWIIAAGAPTAIMTKLKVDPAPDWPAGVYFFGEDVLRVGLVVASELPRDRSTLLVRLMAGGPLLLPAIEELGKLPADANERAVAEQILLRLQHALVKQPNRTPEEEDFVMRMYSTWEDARQLGLKQGRNEGRNEGRAEQAARAVLAALRVRGLAVPDAARERILAEQDPERLERWHERAIVAASVDEVIGEPS